MRVLIQLFLQSPLSCAHQRPRSRSICTLALWPMTHVACSAATCQKRPSVTAVQTQKRPSADAKESLSNDACCVQRCYLLLHLLEVTSVECPARGKGQRI